MPIKSIDIVDAPFNRVLEMLANAAAVPITVDPAVLSAAGISADVKVSVHAQDTTVARVIGTVLREHNLTCEIRDGQLVVIAQSSRSSSPP